MSAFPPRDRPPRLSNRNCCHPDEAMAAIDAKEIADLNGADFEAIFSVSACTAVYDEQLYYLPLALDHLRRDPDDAYDSIAALVHFIYSNGERLARDGYLDPSLAALGNCFDAWTSRFDVVPDGRVEHSGPLCELIEASIIYGLDSVAEERVERWASPSRSAFEAAWLLEFAKRQREDYAAYADAPRGTGGFAKAPTEHSPRIVRIVMNTPLLQAAYDEIKATIVASTPSPTYWRDVAAALGLA